MSSGQVCPNCQGALGANPSKCDYCRMFAIGASSRGFKVAMATMVLSLMVMGLAIMHRMHQEVVPKAQMSQPPPAITGLTHVDAGQSTTVPARSSGLDNLKPWAQLAPNPYATDWYAETGRTDRWAIDGDVLTSSNTTCVLWSRKQTQGDAVVDLDVQLMAPFMMDACVMMHASRALAVDPTRWPWDSGFWFSYSLRDTPRLLVGRLQSNFLNLGPAPGDPRGWHHLRCELSGSTLTYTFDGWIAGSHAYPWPIQEPGYNRIGLVLDAARMRNMKVRLLDSGHPPTSWASGPYRGGADFVYPPNDGDVGGRWHEDGRGGWIEYKPRPFGAPDEQLHFREVSRSPEYVEMYDSSRSLSIRLAENAALAKYDQGPLGEHFWLLHRGSWEVIPQPETQGLSLAPSAAIQAQSRKEEDVTATIPVDPPPAERTVRIDKVLVPPHSPSEIDGIAVPLPPSNVGATARAARPLVVSTPDGKTANALIVAVHPQSETAFTWGYCAVYGQRDGGSPTYAGLVSASSIRTRDRTIKVFSPTPFDRVLLYPIDWSGSFAQSSLLVRWVSFN